MEFFFPKHNRDTTLDLWKYTNQWLLNVDGRFAQNIEYILVFQYATELKQLKGNARITLCMTCGRTFRGKEVNAGMLKNTSAFIH